MKKIMFIGLAALILLMAACSDRSERFDVDEPEQETPYEFEFEDLEGNTYKLSDYAGTPVYLRVWGSWCSVCVSTLGDLNELSRTADDYVVLTIVTPGVAGEMSKEDFAVWFTEYGYDDIVVLIDDKAQIVDDFRIQAYPTQVFFDADGYYKTHMPGAIGKDMVQATFKAMDRIE